jgi:hypothetical protein
MVGSEDGNVYYQQLQVSAGWFKIGDFAYVQQMGVKTVITRIDKMWTNTAGDAFIFGPTYIHPYETEHPPTRTFYVSIFILTQTTLGKTFCFANLSPLWNFLENSLFIVIM